MRVGLLALALLAPSALAGCIDCSGNPFDDEACATYTGIYAWATATGDTNATRLEAAFDDLGLGDLVIDSWFAHARDDTHEVEVMFEGGSQGFSAVRVSVWFTLADKEMPEGDLAERAEKDWPQVQPDWDRIAGRLAGAGITVDEPTFQSAAVLP